MRFDIPRQRFYFFGYELWISEFSIIFFSLMFLMFLVAAMAMFYGRVYCGYLCPQMIFSEASIALEKQAAPPVNKYVRWSAKQRNLLSQSLFYLRSRGRLRSFWRLSSSRTSLSRAIFSPPAVARHQDRRRHRRGAVTTLLILSISCLSASVSAPRFVPTDTCKACSATATR